VRLKYKIKGFVTPSGERYCVLVDPVSGVPLFFPNLFVTTQVRNPQLSPATMEAALTSINVLLTFCHNRGIDLESRCRRRRIFKIGEMDVGTRTTKAA
jgi:hypothetical protein